MESPANDYTYIRLKAQVSVLRDVQREYSTSTISNAISQIESRIKHLEKQ